MRYNLRFGADGELELSRSPLEVEQVLLEVGLLRLEICYLVLQLLALILLIEVGLLHVFFSLEDVSCEILPDLLGLPGEGIV